MMVKAFSVQVDSSLACEAKVLWTGTCILPRRAYQDYMQCKPSEP